MWLDPLVSPMIHHHSSTTCPLIPYPYPTPALLLPGNSKLCSDLILHPHKREELPVRCIPVLIYTWCFTTTSHICSICLQHVLDTSRDQGEDQLASMLLLQYVEFCHMKMRSEQDSLESQLGVHYWIAVYVSQWIKHTWWVSKGCVYEYSVCSLKCKTA